jgi:hypothetical protein
MVVRKQLLIRITLLFIYLFSIEKKKGDNSSPSQKEQGGPGRVHERNVTSAQGTPWPWCVADNFLILTFFSKLFLKITP